MIIINTNNLTVDEAWDELYSILDEIRRSKSALDVYIDEQKDTFYGCTPFFEEALQILETKYGRTWQELVKGK